MSRQHQSMLSPRRFTSIRHQATAITTLGPITGAIPQYQSASDSEVVVMAGITAAGSTVAVTDNGINPRSRCSDGSSRRPLRRALICLSASFAGRSSLDLAERGTCAELPAERGGDEGAVAACDAPGGILEPNIGLTVHSGHIDSLGMAAA